jgi:hypothetical protein
MRELVKEGVIGRVGLKGKSAARDTFTNCLEESRRTAVATSWTDRRNGFERKRRKIPPLQSGPGSPLGRAWQRRNEEARPPPRFTKQKENNAFFMISMSVTVKMVFLRRLDKIRALRAFEVQIRSAWILLRMPHPYCVHPMVMSIGHCPS